MLGRALVAQRNTCGHSFRQQAANFCDTPSLLGSVHRAPRPRVGQTTRRCPLTVGRGLERTFAGGVRSSRGVSTAVRVVDSQKRLPESARKDWKRHAPSVTSAVICRKAASLSEPPAVPVCYPLAMRGMQSNSDLSEGLKVFIATPAFGGNVTVDYMTSVVHLVTQLKEVAWHLQLTAGESIITVGRNNMVMQFLDSDCTHLLFLDADIAFDVDTIRGLLRQDKDVSLAPYPAKNINERKVQEAHLRRKGGGLPRLRDGLHYVLHASPERVQEAFDKGTSFVEVDAGPTGCMLIRRRVFDVMREAYPDLRCRLSGTHAGRAMNYDVWWRFFDTMVSDDGEFLGEDIAFCRRWRATGGQIWADLGATISHVGRHAFTGSIMDSLDDPPKLTRP